ncbi:MAG TPA: putative 2OG-Fe(II) oxygenase [Steroidobacteraceae bacterium]|nr:putative 2OG-Fe(II) oxygenase [Steroidobacteraceae bacterium]
MVTPEVKVAPLFAVPFGEARLAPCEALNRDLEALFLARENDEHRNPTPSHVAQQETFESRFNLFRWPEACVQELRRFMLDAIGRMVLQTTTLGPQDLARLTLHNHTWFHVSRYAGSFVAHNHPMACWSAVYCVRAGEVVAAQPQSGLLRFLDPRQGAGAYQDPAIATMHRAFVARPLEIRLVEGQLLMFPSYVFHEVAPFYGRDTRITVATNCWLA